LIVPVLRLLFSVAPAPAAAASLLYVFANTLAASITYVRNRVADVPRGLVISASAIPSSILGAYVVSMLSAKNFDLIYGIFLVAVGITVFARRNAEPKPRELPTGKRLAYEIATGVFVGFISSFFGIGGGIVLVPTMLVLFQQAVHTVAATSAFVVMLTSPVGIIAHVFYGAFDIGLAAPLAVGGLVGGGIGARLAKRLHARHLSLLIAVLLFVAAVALVLKHL
jgi:uncharacterized membrane protein YfcA